jgi:hypothetical protein
MKAEVWRMYGVLGGFVIIALGGALLTAGFSSSWLLLFVCWLASLFAFLAYIAYEHIAYPTEPVSESELFREVKAIQNAKEQIAAWPQEHRHRPADITAGSNALVSDLAQSSASVFQFAPVPEQPRQPAIEVSDATGEPAGAWQKDFVELRQSLQSASSRIE